MKKLFLSLVVAVLSMTSVVNAQTTIYSYRSWQQVEGDAVTGPIKFQVITHAQ